MAKYNNRKVEIDGIRFDSKAEGNHYLYLKSRLQSGEIMDLVCHPKYIMDVNGVRICTYRPDFQYQESGRLVVEDVKSKPTMTYSYKLKKKLMKAIHGIDVIDVVN